MQDHTLTIDRSVSPSRIEFAPVFNVAVPFIDLHLSEGRGGKVAIRTTKGDITYAELAKNVAQAGNAILSLGAKPGERLLMIVKDCPEFFYLFWGAIKAGVIPVPLNTLLRASDYAYMIDDSGASLVVYSPEFAAEVEPGHALTKNKPKAIRTEGEGECLIGLMAKASDSLAPTPSTEDADCFWLYSSGSTGRPKGTVHRQRDMVMCSQYYGVETLGGTKEDICFSAAKLFFAYGMGNAMTFPLWVGATTVLMEGRPTPDNTFEMIGKFKPTLYFGVPTLYAAQLAVHAKIKPDLSSVRRCVSAGEALPADIYRRWKEATGLIIMDGIGSTEALHIFVSNRFEDPRPGTSGTPITGYEARIVDQDGKPVPQGESGQLHIRGLSTARIYWNQPEKTAATMLEGGWLNTGDTYMQDEGGYFQYCGRNDDMMKVGGIWCSPFEIEAKLVEHEKILESAVVAKPDIDGLIKPEAWVVLKEGYDGGLDMEEELRQHCKRGLAPYKYPRWFHFVEELPKTATGKIQRFKLRQAQA
jgi:benzoate-CoA ligase family protein